MKHYVLGFAFSSDSSLVILIRKERPEWQKGLYNGVGGKIEWGELDIEAMVREFREETGVETNHIDWHFFGRMGGGDWDCSLFAMWDNKVLGAATKTDEFVGKFDPKDLPPSISNLKWLIPAALNHKNHKFTLGVEYAE